VRGSDAELVVRARSGDRAAFGVLVERHRSLLRGLVTRLVRDPGLVDDVVQDAIVTAPTFGGSRIRTARRPDTSCYRTRRLKSE